MRPFVVDVFHVNSKLEISKKRYEADTVEEAESKLEVHKELGDVTRIVISRRIPGKKKVDVMKVWNRPAF
ncbi:MAG: hypothetical protein IJ248_06765 [Candidatus Methanomethylophilaceae archaeon]|nr:hypothetical protein [Candidatus Methanomethylophilaceae archaeon]